MCLIKISGSSDMFKTLICKAFASHFFIMGNKTIVYTQLKKSLVDIGVKEWEDDDLKFTLDRLVDLKLIRYNERVETTATTIQFLQIEEIIAIGGSSTK